MKPHKYYFPVRFTIKSNLKEVTWSVKVMVREVQTRISWRKFAEEDSFYRLRGYSSRKASETFALIIGQGVMKFTLLE